MKRWLFAISLVSACGGNTQSGSPDARDNDAPDLIDADPNLPPYEGGDAHSWTIAQSKLAAGWPQAENQDDYVFVVIDGGNGPYALAGDFNQWQPEPMNQANGYYWLRKQISDPVGSRYKYVDNNGTYFADPWARAFQYDENGEISFVRASRSHFRRYFDNSYSGLQSRRVVAWVPSETPTHHLYVHDGQNVFSVGAIGGGWGIHESAGSKTLIIAIDNTSDRFSEYTHTSDRVGGNLINGTASAYGKMIWDNIRPMIEAEFPSPQKRGILGSSLGGLVSIYVGNQHPFDFAGSLSGTLGWGSMQESNATLINNAQNGTISIPAIYLDSGGGAGSGCVDADQDGNQDDGGGADNYCETRQMADVLASKGYVWDQSLFHWWEPNAQHNEAAWRARVFRPLAIFEGL